MNGCFGKAQPRCTAEASESGRKLAAAWDAALGAPVRKVTVADLHFRAHHGLVRVQAFRGRYRGWWQKPDNSALLRLCARLDQAVRGAG